MVITIQVDGRKQLLFLSDACQLLDGADVGLGIVLRGWCPSVEDVPHVDGFLLGDEAVEVRVERAPCSALAIGHALDGDKLRVGLFFGHALPLGTGLAYVEWVVVSESSWFHGVLKLF